MNKESGALSFELDNYSKEKLLVKATFLIVNRKGLMTHRVQVKKIFAPIRDSPTYSFGAPNDVRVYDESKTMSVDDFIKKDVLDNKMEDMLDQGGCLNIHLKMTGTSKNTYKKRQGSRHSYNLLISVSRKLTTVTDRVYETGLNDTPENVQGITSIVG